MSQATDQINFDQLAEQILSQDGVLPDYAIPFAIYQNRLESNNYSSNVFMTNNNLNGYEYVSGDTLQSGPGIARPASEGGYYANFPTVENSLHEQSAWWQRRIDDDGFDITTLTSVPNFANALATFQWYTSSPAAYIARMYAVAPLVSLQSSGINTQGVSLTTLSIGTLALIAGGVYLVYRYNRRA